MSKLVKSIQEVAWHRNGIMGEGFYAVRFTSDIDADDGTFGGKLKKPLYEPTDGKKDANFLAILFDEPGRCAVICLDLIPTCGVKFAGGNSWRGDHYETELRAAIETEQSSGSVRVGPFGVPTE